ncbi:RING-H2 finger protein ATL52-like protein [Tanacetum coccineum]|uniref:RING-H2 finger protein ATL52-like protein n=1 Tax=Tanacetum coccineum TaxID=301880 RepID=A0ABQ5I710_9ASTR
MEDNSLTLKLISLLVIVSLVAVLVAVYHFITVSWCNRRRNPIPPLHVHQQSRHQDNNDYSLENSVVLLIPAHKHQKVLRLDAKGGECDDDEAMCSICLCEFEDNEELRTLPECLHSFHVPCIDMWLFSHSTCPVCRADAVPSSQILFQFLDSDSDVASNIV